jgi:endonuclease YncB( thermonuclease family)
VVAGLLILILNRVAVQTIKEPGAVDLRSQLEPGSYYVEDVLDSSHVLLRSAADARVLGQLRLLGVAAPGEDDVATDSTARQMLSAWTVGRRVRLQLDRRRRSTDGILLGYLFADEHFLNAALLRHGLVRLDVHASDSQSITRALRRAAEDARQLGRGRWRTTH